MQSDNTTHKIQGEDDWVCSVERLNEGCYKLLKFRVDFSVSNYSGDCNDLFSEVNKVDGVNYVRRISKPRAFTVVLRDDAKDVDRTVADVLNTIKKHRRVMKEASTDVVMNGVVFKRMGELDLYYRVEASGPDPNRVEVHTSMDLTRVPFDDPVAMESVLEVDGVEEVHPPSGRYSFGLTVNSFEMKTGKFYPPEDSVPAVLLSMRRLRKERKVPPKQHVWIVFPEETDEDEDDGFICQRCRLPYAPERRSQPCV